MVSSITPQDLPLATAKTPLLPKEACPALTSSVHQYFMLHSPKDIEAYLPGNVEYLIHSGSYGSFSPRDIKVLNEGLSNKLKIQLPPTLTLTPSNTDTKVPYPFSSPRLYVNKEELRDKCTYIIAQLKAQITHRFSQKYGYDAMNDPKNRGEGLDRNVLITQLGYSEDEVDNMPDDKRAKIIQNYFYTLVEKNMDARFISIIIDSLPTVIKEDQELVALYYLLVRLSLGMDLILEESFHFSSLKTNSISEFGFMQNFYTLIGLALIIKRLKLFDSPRKSMP